MRVEARNIYTFEELSPEIQEKVLEKNRDVNVDYDWWDFTYDDAKDIGKLMGIDIDRIYFSGFSSQGDGACFEGYYSYAKGSVKAVKSYAPQDKELHRIVEGLMKVQKKDFYQLEARIKQSGHYCHEYCTDIDVDRIDGKVLSEYAEDGVKEFLRDYMRWIYQQLEKEYEYRTSDEVILDTIVGNSWEFDEYGNMI